MVVGTVTAILISLAISAALTVVSRLLAPHQQAPQIGGSLQPRDQGTELTLRNAAEPHQIVFGERRVKGNIIAAFVVANNVQLVLVIEWAGHKVEELGDLYFDNELIPFTVGGENVLRSSTGRSAGFVGMTDHLGYDTPEPDTFLIAESGGQWTTQHLGCGKAWSAVYLNWAREQFPQGLPNIWRVVKGMEVYDPRDDSTGWSANAALCTAAFMNSERYGRDIPYGGLNGIDLDALSAAANICDEDVPLAEGGSEKRYTCNAVLTSDAAFIDNLESLLASFVGTATPIGGAWILKAAAWEAPAIFFDENDFRAGFELQNGIEATDAFNAVKGTFTNPSKLWQPDDFPAVTSSVYEAEDGGDRNFKDVKLECVTSAATAQRLARIDLRRARQVIAFTAPLKLRGLLVQPGDTVGVSFAALGWEEKPFFVDAMKLIIGFAPGANQGTAQPGIIGVDVTLRETAEAIYDWDPAIDEQTVDPAPNTTLPDLFNPLPPSNIEVEEELYETRSGNGVKTRALLSWPASPDAFIKAYRVRYRMNGAVDWNVLADVTGLATSIDDILPGQWDFAVAGVNAADVVSPYVQRTTTITGLLAIPGDPTGLTAVTIGGLAILRWTATTDLDVRIGGKVVIRHSSVTSGATWDAASPIGGDELPGGDTLAVLSAKSGTYLLKFRDSSLLYSETPAAVVVEQAALTGFTTPSGGSLVEDPTFSGAKTNCSVVSSQLALDVGELTGSYDFSAVMDLSSVLRVRLTTDIAVQVVNNTDSWDSTELCDSSDPWDAVVTGNEAVALIYVRKTNDDPGGSPTWTDWNRLDSAEYEGRAFQYRCDLQAFDPDFGIEISELAVVAEEAA